MTRTVIIAVLACVGLAAVAIGRWPGSDLPRVGDLVRHLVRRPAGRAIALTAWVWVGWHFFGR